MLFKTVCVVLSELGYFIKCSFFLGGGGGGGAETMHCVRRHCDVGCHCHTKSISDATGLDLHIRVLQLSLHFARTLHFATPVFVVRF